MLIYYRLSGADRRPGAAAQPRSFCMAAMAGFQATLTLPGIAGIVLTIGMAVDTNILIFERIREELRSGKTVRAGDRRGLRPRVHGRSSTPTSPCSCPRRSCTSSAPGR